MGQYRLSITMKSQIGFLVTWYPGSELIIDIPFVTIYIGLNESASGVDIFGRSEW